MGLYYLHFTFSLGRITKEPRKKDKRLVGFVVIGDGVAVLDIARQIAM